MLSAAGSSSPGHVASNAESSHEHHGERCKPVENQDFALDKSLHLLINDDVLMGILDHAYSDPKNEIIGHLGGQFDPETRIVHATIFSAGRRVVSELSATSVEGDPEDLHEAQTEFDKKGIKYVGWYHSHPKIVPTPSSKDSAMQAEMQRQVPFAFGLICSPFMERSQQRETYYFNAFRVALDGPHPMLLKVAFSVNKSRIPACLNVSNTIESNKKHLKEASQTYQAALPTSKGAAASSSSSSSAAISDTQKLDLLHTANVKQQYAAFLSHFTNCGVSGSITALETDVRGIRYSLAHQRERLSRNLAALARLNKKPYDADQTSEMDWLKTIARERAVVKHVEHQLVRFANLPCFRQAENMYPDDIETLTLISLFDENSQNK